MEETLGKVSSNFSRGLNSAMSHMINPEEVQSADNFLFDQGGPRVREGTALNASLPYPVVALRKVYLQNGSSYFAAFAGGQLYVSTASGVFTVVSGPTMSGDIFTSVYDDVLYFTNFSTPVQYYDGTMIDTAGLSSPSFTYQISELDDPSGWVVAGSGTATVDPDTTITHVDIGQTAIRLTTYGVASYGVPGRSNLNFFGSSNISSDMTDLISIFTVHDVKANFSSVIFGFGTAFPGLDFTKSNMLPYQILWSDIGWNGNAFVATAITNYLAQAAYSNDGVIWSGFALNEGGTAYWNDRPGGLTTGMSGFGTFCYVDYYKYRISWNGLDWNATDIHNGLGGAQNCRRYPAGNMSMFSDMVHPSDGMATNYVYPEWSYDGLHWGSTLISNYSGGDGWYHGYDNAGTWWFNGQWVAIASSNMSGKQLGTDWSVFTTWWSYDGKNYTGSNGNFNTTTMHNRYGATTNTKLCVIGNRATPKGTYSYGLSDDNSVNIATVTPNGYDWTQTTVTTAAYNTSYGWGPIAANSTRFVAFTRDANWAVYSDDGITWNSTGLPITASWSVAAWGSGFFYAAAANSDILLRSTDGIAWNQVSISGINIPTQHVDLVQMSTWIGCGNDGWALTHVIPKSLFSAQSGYVWASATPYIQITSTGQGTPAVLTVDNLRMIKTPPVVIKTSSTVPPLMFFGSSLVKVDRFMDDPMEQTTKGLQLQGFLISGNIIQDGNTYYKTTFIKVGPHSVPIESNPSYESSGVFVSNTAVQVVNQLSFLPIAPSTWNVVGRRIYRRNANTSSFQYAYMVHNNSGTNFIDRVPMTILGDVLDETGHWPPPNARYIYAAADQRTYYYNIIESNGQHTSRVRYSKPYEPYYVPLEDVFDIAPGDGTEGTGMFEFMGMLHFLKERSTWILDTVTGSPQQSHSTLGCIAPKSLAVSPEAVFWFSDQGIVMYSLRYRVISKEGMRVDSIIQNLPKNYRKNAVGVYYNNFYLLAVTQNSTVNDTILVYDILNNLWSVFPNINVECWTTWQGFQDGYRLFYGNLSGNVCEFLTGNDDMGTPIYSRLRTKEFGQASPDAAFQQLYLYTQDLDGQSRTIQVNPYYDWTNTAADSDQIVTASSYGVGKVRLPGKPGAGFFSAEFITSGRYQIMRLDLYGKREGLR